MIPHKPHTEPENTKEMPDAPPGRHRMKLNRVKEGVESPRWRGDVWEFVGGGYAISEFVNEDTVWKYSRLAKAIGGAAQKAYQDTDSDGNSLFDPIHYIGSEVSILVEPFVRNGQESTRIKKIDSVSNASSWDTESVPVNNSVNDDPSPETAAGTAVEERDDDIPF